ncbi:transcriptional corepressor SEUSS-like [Apium graveolens]|uniref:transcriptional corepressor SEUSS-like n=1 Tax=Apium graveolens TaxID=4045 RepID=UPI003D7928B6
MGKGLNNGPLNFVPGNCAKRLIQYHQLHLSANASIASQRELVSDFFAPSAKRRWCFSQCKNHPKQAAPFAQRAWQCQVCKHKPGCGYEVTAETLPALSKIGFETGILKEFFSFDMPSEHQTLSGEIVVHSYNAPVEAVYQNLRVVHDGQLCVVFTPDLKISSWDFCIRNIEQFISGNTLLPQVDKLRFLSCEYKHAAENDSSYLQSSTLKRYSDALAEEAYKFESALNLPQVTDVGFTRRYVRYMEMSEVVNLRWDLIDHNRAAGINSRTSPAILGSSSSEDGEA